MAVIGFIALVVALLVASATTALTCANSIGSHTIGGQPNTPLERAGACLLILGVGLLWYLLFHFAPFTISFKA